MQSIPNWLKQRAMLTPHREALIYEEQSWTFLEMQQKSEQYAQKIARFFLNKNDVVAVLLKNRPHAVWIIHALQQLNVQTVFLNKQLTTEELTYQLKDSQATLLICENEFKVILKEFEEKSLKVTTVADLNCMPSQSVDTREMFPLDDVCSIMYTSGTTGKPKGVLQTYGNHWWSAVGSVLNLGLNENDAWLCTMPLFHISGLSILIRSIVYGIPVYLMEQFDEKKVNQLLQTGKITIMSVVSTMVQRMLADLGEKKYAPALRCLLLGGGPAPKPLLEACKSKGIPIFQTYGMTETASQIVTLSPEDSLKKLGSAGKPLFPAQIRIISEEGTPGAHTIGEIMVKGPNITKGYLNRPDANKASFQDDWFLTGDIGSIDEEGYLYVLDRRSDLIISGGENIYPAEIEEVLIAHDAIAEAGVAGVDDPEWGKVPYGFVVSLETVSEAELLAFCRSKLAKYKVPKRIIFVNALPKTASNKLLRRELAALIPS